MKKQEEKKQKKAESIILRKPKGMNKKGFKEIAWLLASLLKIK
jgi:hypothetical protein